MKYPSASFSGLRLLPIAMLLLWASAPAVAQQSGMDELPTVTLSPASVEEDVGTATFTASLSETADQTVTVEWRTVDGSAVAGQDYTAKTGTLTFTSTSPNPTLTVDIADDSDVEGTETFTISMTSSNGTAKASAHEVAILVDEPLPTLASLTNTPLDGLENSTVTDKITATLSAASPVDLHLFWRAENGTAVEGEDFSLVPERFRVARIPAGNSTYIWPAVSFAEILTSVTELDDMLYEGTETFSSTWTLRERTRSDPALGDSIKLEHEIQDNDAPPTLSLTSSASPVGEADGKVTITATLTGGDARQGDLTVDYATADGTAGDENGDGDYEAASGTLTFAPGDSSKTFDVAITNDTVYEPGADETFAVSATLKDRTGALAKTSAGSTAGSSASLNVTIEDDDSAPTLVSLTHEPNASLNVEGGFIIGNYSVAMSSQSAADMYLSWEMTDGTAVAGQDFDDVAESRRFLRIPAGSATYSVTAFTLAETGGSGWLPQLDDSHYEGTETLSSVWTLRERRDRNAPALGAPITIQHNIADNDDPPTLSLTASASPVGEADGKVAITATLTGGDSRQGNLTVDYATADGTAGDENGDGDYEAASGTLTFAPGDSTKTFDVAITNDSVFEPGADETFAVSAKLKDRTGALAKTPSGSASGSDASLNLAIEDDDAPTVVLTPSSVEENVGTATFTASLSEAVDQDVTVEWRTVDGTAVAGQDYTSKSGTLRFTTTSRNPTLTIDIADDSAVEGSETFTISMASANGTAKASAHEVTILVDEALPTLTSLTNEPRDGLENSTVTDKITATLSAASPVDLHLYWRAENGTAVEGEDFSLVPERFRTVRIPAGNATYIWPAVSFAEILTSVTELDDMLYEGTETFSTIWTLHEKAKSDPALGDSIKLGHEIQDNDAPPVLSLTAFPSPVGESDGKTTVTATLTGGDPRQGNLTVDYATSDGTAEDENGDGDYEAASGSLTFAPGDTSKTFEVAITNDAIYEPGADETFSVSATLKDRTGALAKTSSGDASGSAASLLMPIEDDDDPPTVVLSPSRVAETAGTATFTASLNGGSAQDVTVEYGTGAVGDTADAGMDYTAKTGTLTFTSSSTSPTLTIDIANDALDEGDETFTISLNSADGSAAPSAHVVTIDDDDGPPPVSLNVSSVDEGDGTVTFAATLGAASGRPVTVEYATADGTAEAGEDYSRATGTLSFAKGVTQDTFTVVITDDALDEGAETFDIELSSADGTAQESTHEVTITDDDDPPTVSLAPASVDEDDGMVTFTATLSAKSGRAVTVEYSTADGTAKAGEDYASATGTLTFAKGDTQETFALGIAEDSLYEGDETFDIDLTSSNGTAQASTHEVTISDNEDIPVVTLASVLPASVNESTETQRIRATAELNIANATSDVTVSVDAADGSAKVANGDYEDPAAVTLTIPQGERTGTANIEVVVNSDNLHEGTETFDIALSAPQGATLGRSSSLPVTIIDQDSAMFALSVNAANVIEGGRATAIVTLLTASQRMTLRVDYATVAGAAKEGDDYVAKSGRLTFRPGGALKQEFDIEIVDDELDEGDESFFVVLSNPDGADAALGTSLRQEVTITDDDPLPALTLTLPRSSVAEGGKIEARATLTPASGREVTVDYATGDGQAEDENGSGDYMRASGTLTFAPGETAKTFSVQTADDRTPEGDENFEIVLSGERNATLRSPATRQATIEDDDATEITLSANTSRVTEGGIVAVTARLSVASEGQVLVHCATADGAGAHGATAGEDYVGSSSTLRFLPGEREKVLRINIHDDALDERDETFSITLSNPRGGGAILGTGASRRITILDNDALPTLTLALDRTSVEEGGRVVATATLSPASGREVSVEAAVVDGTTDVRDRTLTGLTGGRLTFAKGDASETFAVEIADDRLNELAETFDIVLRDPEGARLGALVSGRVTILADAADPEPTVAFAKGTGSVREGDRFEITARLSVESGREVTVEFETADIGGHNAATAGEDYVAMSGMLTFAPGQTERTYSDRMLIMADGLEEQNEVFDVALSAPVGATMGATSTMRVTILDGDDPILKPIASYLSGRAEALLDNQPRLIRFLSGSEKPSREISLSADGDGASADGGFVRDDVWGEASGSWSSDGGTSHRHFVGTFGSHRMLSDNLLVGGMLQLDAIRADLDGNGEIDGRGWMAGPYFAARDESGQLHFEGRLLYGRSSNDIAEFIGSVPGTAARKGSFNTARWLAQARVEGRLPLRNGALMIPLADLGHAGEEAESFRDNVREVESQSTSVTRLSLGTSFEIPVEADNGNLMLRPGMQFLLIDENGGRYGESSRDSAGRIDFGMTYQIEDSVELEFDCFYSGIGRSERHSFGASVNLRMEF